MRVLLASAHKRVPWCLGQCARYAGRLSFCFSCCCLHVVWRRRKVPLSSRRRCAGERAEVLSVKNMLDVNCTAGKKKKKQSRRRRSEHCQNTTENPRRCCLMSRNILTVGVRALCERNNEYHGWLFTSEWWLLIWQRRTRDSEQRDYKTGSSASYKIN